MDDILSPVGPKASLSLLSHLAAKAELTVAGGLFPPEALPEALPPRIWLVIMSGYTSSLYRALAPAYNQHLALPTLTMSLYCCSTCSSNSRRRALVTDVPDMQVNQGLSSRTHSLC